MSSGALSGCSLLGSSISNVAGISVSPSRTRSSDLMKASLLVPRAKHALAPALKAASASLGR